MLSVKLAVVAFVLLGAWRSVALGRRLWGYASAGYLFAGVYLTVPYTLSNLYARGDLAEFGATMLYPIIVDAYLAYRDRGGLGRALLLALSYGALVPMHAFSALLFTLGGGLVVAWLAYVERTSPRRLGGAVAACALGVGMASFYWIPVFAELGTVSTEALFHADAIAQTAISVVGLVDHEARSAVAGRWISYGPWVVALAALGLMPRGRTPAYSRRPWVGALFVLGLLAGLLSTHAMVWFYGVVSLLAKIAFPWRWLSVGSLALALLAARAPTIPTRRLHGELFGLGLLGATIVYTFFTLPPLDEVEYSEAFWDLEQRGPREFILFDYGEFFPAEAYGHVPRPTTHAATARGCRIVEESHSPLTSEVRVEAVDSARECSLTFRRFAWHGFETTTDGGAPELLDDNHGRIRVAVPPGEHVVRVEWVSTRAIAFAGYATLFFFAPWVGLLGYAISTWARERRLERGASVG